MPVQLQYVQLSTGKNNAADLSGGVFAILSRVTRNEKYQIHCRSTDLVKDWQTVM